MNTNKLKAKKRSYHSPQVRDYGNIKEITATTTRVTGAADNPSRKT